MEIGNLANRIGLPAGVYRTLLEMFVKTSRGDLERIELALETGPPETGTASAHSLKGAALGLGLTRISQSAYNLEQHLEAGQREEARRELQAIGTALDKLSALIPDLDD